MKSIQKSLTRRLSISISAIVIIALLLADLAIDKWVTHSFDVAIRDKVGLLQTLVTEEADGVEFEFADEFLPEFQDSENPEFFELWYQGRVFERSESIRQNQLPDLPLKQVQLNELVLEDTLLPDGRSGRIAYIKFVPQIDSEDRPEFPPERLAAEREPILLAYAISTEQLNYQQWYVDISFLAALIVVPLVVKLIVAQTVTTTLAPLQKLKTDISNVRLSGARLHVDLAEPIEELNPITESVNHFIEQNRRLYEREKRLTSDIAHELKTPVTELINLAEIAIRFPEDKAMARDFQPEMLKIGLRMKSIISSLMLIHRYSHQQLDCNDVIDITALIQKIVLNKEPTRTKIISAANKPIGITTNSFAIESILNNLIANALEHSESGSDVSITTEHIGEDTFKIDIANIPKVMLTEDELQNMFEPLWQKDSARTSVDNFGLGLTLVKVLTDAIGAKIYVSTDAPLIHFTLLVRL